MTDPGQSASDDATIEARLESLPRASMRTTDRFGFRPRVRLSFPTSLRLLSPTTHMTVTVEPRDQRQISAIACGSGLTVIVYFLMTSTSCGQRCSLSNDDSLTTTTAIRVAPIWNTSKPLSERSEESAGILFRGRQTLCPNVLKPIVLSSRLFGRRYGRGHGSLQTVGLLLK